MNKKTKIRMIGIAKSVATFFLTNDKKYIGDWEEVEKDFYVLDNHKGYVSFNEENEIVYIVVGSCKMLITQENMETFSVSKYWKPSEAGAIAEELVKGFENSIKSKVINDKYFNLRNEILKRLKEWESHERI